MIRTNDGTQYKRLPNVGDLRPTTSGFQREVATYTAIGGETSINLALLSPALSYMPGRNQLSIKRSSGGALMRGAGDFTETSSTTIGFGDPLIANEIVEITKEFTVTGIAALAARPDCYTATATTGQTLVTCDFSWPYNLNSSKAIGGVSVYLNGVLQTRNVDFTEVSLGTANTNQIDFTLSGALLGGENIIIVPTYQVIDDAGASTQFNNTRVTGLQNLLSAGAQNFVDQSSDMIAVPNTTIVGRAKIPNLANDLRASLGIDRVAIQNIMQLQNEFGLNGEPVFAALNDDRGLIRFIGAGWSSSLGSIGTSAYNSGVVNDTFEITFYGTNLNLLIAADEADVRATVDGGSEGSDIVVAQSTILYNRGYAANTVQVAIPTQTLGIHTVKFRIATNNDLILHGFEILNSNASGLVNVNPGTGYIGGLKVVKSSASSVAYNTGVTGTRGGRVVRYLNPDASVGQAFTPTNAAAAYLAAADHANEEVARPYHWREFGAGRTDDFGYQLDGTSRAFTLDDGTTTLVANQPDAAAFGEYITFSSLGEYLTMTFVGTGVDVIRKDGGSTSADTFTAYIDGVSVGTLSTAASTSARTVKIASGLAYGTHILKLERTAGSTDRVGFSTFIVYQPKKPAIPTSALELCDYNVMAQFSSPSAGVESIAAGVLRKGMSREMVYGGSGWAFFSFSAMGWITTTSTNNDYLQYTFFGTGFSYRFQNASAAVVTAQMTLTDTANPAGTTNFSGFTVASNGAGIASFVASTATLTTTTTNTVGNVISVSDLALGWHTIKIIKLSGVANFFQEAMDIITPIHSHKSNLYADLQNTLPVGSQSLMDSRKTSMIKEVLPAQKAWVQAVGVAASPTTTSTTAVPQTDMSVTVRTKGSPIEITYASRARNSGTGGTVSMQVYVDGAAVHNAKAFESSVANDSHTLTDSFIVPVSEGYHKVDLRWWVGSGTGTVFTRGITVQEI